MVRVSYDDIDSSYERVKARACGLTACSVMVLVASEVDALASARMLTHKLRSDNIAYTIRPVSNISQVQLNKEAFFTEQIKTVFMINCGARFNIPKLFGIEGYSDFRVYIMDNHRPLDLGNVASRENVTVFVDNYEVDEDLPDYDEELEQTIYDYSDDDSDKSEEEGDFGSDYDDSSDEEEMQDEPNGLEMVEEGKEDDDESSAASAASDSDADSDQGSDREGALDAAGDAASNANQDDSEVDSEVDEANADQDNTEQASKPELEVIGAAENDGEEGNTSNESPDPVDDDDEEERVFKRRRVEPEVEKKKRFTDHYNQSATFTSPTALMMLSLVSGRTGSHLPLDLIWQAILGVTDHYQKQRIHEEEYNEYCEMLHLRLADHLSAENGKYTVGEGELEIVVPGAQTGHIEEGSDFRFFLFRHWSLFDAMCFSPYAAAKLGVWQGHGTGRLQELLAKMGVPLDQCKQTYNFMAPGMKRQFHRQIAGSVAREYGFCDPDVTCRSFFRFNSFKNPVAAGDIVHAASALIEAFKTVDEADEKAVDASRLKAFDEAYDCLGMKAEDKLKKGLQLSINLQKMIVRKASGLLENHLDKIRTLKSLSFLKVSSSSSGVSDRVQSLDANDTISASSAEDGEIDAPFSRPMVLLRLGQYIMDVMMSMPRRDGGWSGKRLLPLILIGDERRGKTPIVGISPLQSTIARSALSHDDVSMDSLVSICNFNAYFKSSQREVAKESGKDCYTSDSFDAHVIEIPTEEMDPGDFVYQLNQICSSVLYPRTAR